MSTKVTNPRVEDLLSYLPRVSVFAVPRGEVIYGWDEPPLAVYLIVEGLVRIANLCGDTEVGIRIRGPEQHFGEAAMVQAPGEKAEAITDVRLMRWSREEMEGLINAEPRLAFGLIQELTLCNLDLGRSLASMSADSIPRRLARILLSLLEYAHPAGEEAVLHREVAYLPHKTLAQHVGTSRELVTHALNQFRADGMIAYGRNRMAVNEEALRSYLHRTAHPQRNNTELSA